jgi:hypothetical protein
MGVVDGVADGDPVREYLTRSGWPAYLSVWLVPLLAGLTIVGAAAVPRRPLRGLGVAALAMGGFRLVLLPHRPRGHLGGAGGHVGSGLLFSLAWGRGCGRREPDARVF